MEEDIVLPECPIEQNLADYRALSTLPEGVYGKGTQNLGGSHAAVKPGWLYRITVSEERSIDTKALVSAAKQMGGFEGLKFIWAPPPTCFPTALQAKDTQKR